MHGGGNRPRNAEGKRTIRSRAGLDGIFSVKQSARVPNPPKKPLLIFDGDCHFCRRWIERWRELTGGAIEYAPFQEVAERFPEIPRENFEQAVHFIDSDGSVYRGADAVFRSLARRTWIWCYKTLPGFAFPTEAANWFVARGRMFAAFFTRPFSGKELRRRT